jgi:hypothetical protein
MIILHIERHRNYYVYHFVFAFPGLNTHSTSFLVRLLGFQSLASSNIVIGVFDQKAIEFLSVTYLYFQKR